MVSSPLELWHYPNLITEGTEQIGMGEMAKRLKGKETKRNEDPFFYSFSLFAFSPFPPLFSAASVASPGGR